MSDTANAATILEIARRIRAPRAKVFAAFTEGEHFRRWWGPKGFVVGALALEAKPGGAYRVEMISAEGNTHILSGTYREVKAPERLVFTWRWGEGKDQGPESLVTLDFAEAGGETDMRVRHEGFPDRAARDSHQTGWSSSLDRLAWSALEPTVYGSAPSTYTRTVRMALVEKGVPYRLESADFGSDALLARHPFNKIPAFKAGEVALFETAAICRYIDEAFDGPALQPSSPEGRARATQWMSAVADYIYPTLVRDIIIQRIVVPRRGGTPDEARIAAAKPMAERQILILDRFLGENPYLAGAQATLADFFLAPIIAYAAMVPDTKDLVAKAPNLSSWFTRVSNRTSFKATAG